MACSLIIGSVWALYLMPITIPIAFLGGFYTLVDIGCGGATNFD
jgi:hypothetical protein